MYLDSKFRREGSNSTAEFQIEWTQSLQLPNPWRCCIDEIIIPHSWFNIDETNNRIDIKRFPAGIGDELADVVTLAVKNYTSNALADDIKKKLGADFNGVYYADTLQVEITKSRPNFRLKENCLMVWPQLAPTKEITLNR